METRKRLEQVVSLSCQEVSEVGITPKMIFESCVIKLGELASDFCQNIVDLEAQILPNTPSEVLEERQKKVEEDIRQIQEAKALCAKAYEQTSQAWEALMNDVEMQDITKISLDGLQTSLKDSTTS